MLSTLRPSQNIAVIATIAPASQAIGPVSSGWISFNAFEAMMGLVQNGALGVAATIDAIFQQALDGIGTGAKPVVATGMVQNVVATDNGKVNIINLLERDLDVANGFQFVQLTVTVGVAASFAGALVLGVNERYGPAARNNAVFVKQVVN